MRKGCKGKRFVEQHICAIEMLLYFWFLEDYWGKKAVLIKY